MLKDSTSLAPELSPAPDYPVYSARRECSTPLFPARPERSERLFARPADRAACREMIRDGSRSFFVASLFLPEEVREAAYAVYAFCRLSDDTVDLGGGRLAAVNHLMNRLDRIYAGDPESQPVDRSLADTVSQFDIPRTALDALLEGLSWDVEGRTYETLPDLYDYAARVAGSVGVLMAALMGARGSGSIARACDLGVAMQLTNIARDVGEDAAAGRLYLPRVWLREAGLDPDAWLAQPRFCGAIAIVVARLLQEADGLYRRADAGIANLEASYRPAIYAARYLYAEIGVRLEERGFDSISIRTRVPAWRKVVLLAKAVRMAIRGSYGDIHAPALQQTRFLVDSLGGQGPVLASPKRGPRRLQDDFAWTIELFARLERRSQSTVTLQTTGSLT